MHISELARRLGSMTELPEYILEEVQELDRQFAEWKTRYGIAQFVPADDNSSQKVSRLDGELIWTRCYGSEEYGAAGFFSYPGTNFAILGWWIATVPWSVESETFVQLNLDFPCPTCQSEEDPSLMCSTCLGETVCYVLAD